MKFKKGQTAYYMFLNLICKCKILDVIEKEGDVYYKDAFGNEILEKFMFLTKEELFDFHSGRIK